MTVKHKHKRPLARWGDNSMAVTWSPQDVIHAFEPYFKKAMETADQKEKLAHSKVFQDLMSKTGGTNPMVPGMPQTQPQDNQGMPQ